MNTLKSQLHSSVVLHDLRQETDAARALIANFSEILGDDERARIDTIDGETSLLDAMTIAVARSFEIDLLLKGIDEAVSALGTRASRLIKQKDHLRTALCVAMEATTMAKFETPLATISLRNVPPKVEITDEAAIPAKFWKPQDPKLDRKAVLDALKAKEIIPGATLSNGGVTLALKGS